MEAPTLPPIAAQSSAIFGQLSSRLVADAEFFRHYPSREFSDGKMDPANREVVQDERAQVPVKSRATAPEAPKAGW